MWKSSWQYYRNEPVLNDVEAIATFQGDIASSKHKQKYCATGSEDTKTWKQWDH